MTTLMDAVATAAAGVPRLYGSGKVPPNPTYPYGVFSAQLGEDVAYSLEGGGGPRGVQIVLQAFGRTGDSLTAVVEPFRGSLIGRFLNFDGYEAGPFRSELRPTPPIRDPDDAGVLGVTTTLTATAATT